MTALVQKPFHNLKKIKHRNERRAEEKKIRNKPEKPPTDVELVGLTVVKIKQDDEVARRMKQWGNINNISPQFLPHYNRPSDTHSRPPDHMQPPPTHLHPSAARPPSSAAVSEQPRGRSSADNGAAGAMSGGSTGSEHKDKKHKKDKRKASSHSEERPLKKKSKDKDKDKEKDKEKEKFHSHLSAINKDGSGGAHSLGQPKKISQRSTSVSSDRSDHSTKTGTGRTSVDHKHSKHGHSGGGTGSSSSKSSTKHPSSSGSKSSKNNISSHPNQGESASANNRHSSHLTSSAQGASSSKGAHHTEARLGSGSSGAGGSANDMNSESYTKNLLNSKSSGKDSTTQHINGLIRTKPTNLVIPSATKPTNPVPPTQHNTSSSADKDDSDVSRLLEKMVNPGFEKLGQIQTPVKSDMKYEYPIEPPPSLSNNYTTTKLQSKSNSSKHNNSSSNSHAESKDRGSTSTNNNKLSPIKISKIPVVQQNGVENDLKLSPSASDSDGEDSGSSSDSSSGSSSSSSSSSGSDSDSDSDADNTTTKSPPKLFHNLQPSPAPANRFNEEEKKDPWSLEKLMSKPAVTSTAAPSASAAPSQSKTSTTSTGSTQKRGRGRPKKNDNNKKNDDPDFTPGVIPGKQAPPVTTPTVTTDRSKRKKPGSEDPPKKRGRPPKNKPKEQDPKPLSSLSSDESSNHAHFATLPEPSSGSAKPSSMSGVPKLPLNEPGSRTAGSAGIGASTGAWGEDEDVDVEVTDSPHSHKSSFQPVPKTELHNKPSVKLKPEPLPLPTKITSILPKHEPISPVEDTPVRFPHLAFSSTTNAPPPSGYRPPGMPAAPVVGRTTAPGTNSRPHRGDMDSITSLPFSIPLHKLRRNPAITPLRSIKAEKHMPIPSLPGIKQEPTSPSGKKRTKPMSPLDTLLFIKNKRPKPEVKTPDDEPCSPFINNSSISQKNNHMPRPPPLHSGHNTGHKDISRSIPPPAYDEPQFGYETARSLKKQATALGADITKGINTDQKAKVERLLLSLESVINFLVSGLGQETGKQPSVKKIRTYYRNTLDLATQLFDEITRESNIQPRSIFQCSQVLCNYTIAHLKHKCFKLTKDTMSVSGRRIQDQVKQKLSISPAITGNSPAPSPASIASTGSVTSDGGRGSSMPPSGPVIGVPESLLKDVSEFIKNQNFLSEAVDLWRNTNLCREHDLDTPEFFQMLEEDLGYKAEFLLESRQFIHFVHTACKKLQAKLHSS